MVDTSKKFFRGELLRYACLQNAHIRVVCSAFSGFVGLEFPTRKELFDVRFRCYACLQNAHIRVVCSAFSGFVGLEFPRTKRTFGILHVGASSLGSRLKSDSIKYELSMLSAVRIFCERSEIFNKNLDYFENLYKFMV